MVHPDSRLTRSPYGLMRTIVRLTLIALSASTALAQPAKPPKAPPTLVALQPRIDDAIHRGVDAILRTQQADGTWSDHGYAYPVGPTALCTYALLKSGLKPEHPAVARALHFLEHNLSNKTYGVGCQLMALEATKDKRYKPQIKELLGRLLDWQRGGGWAYPGSHIDLSNTQYGALGFRAARLAGLKVPRSAILKLMRHAQHYQEQPKTLEVPADPFHDEGYARTAAPGNVAGFGYRVPKTGQAQSRVNGSMTTAGLGVLLICQELLDGKIPRRSKPELDASIERGLNWMRLNWSVERNPGSGGHHLYYLYGLERVGGLMHREAMAGRYWYREGADVLVRKQNAAGAWGGNPDNAFALLFLKRATRLGSVTGAGGTDRAHRTYLAARDDAEVEFRGAGNPNLSLWITGFNQKKLKKRFPKGGKSDREVHVKRVEYLIDGKVVHSVAHHGEKSWKDEPFAYRHPFKRCGRYSIAARVHVKNPDAGNDGEADTIPLESPLMVIDVLDLPDPDRDAIGTSIRNNRLSKIPMRITHSTIKHRWPIQRPFIGDGILSTAWLCTAQDAKPWLRFRPKDSVRIKELIIWPNQTGAKIKKIEVLMNRTSKPRVINLAHPRRPVQIPIRGRRTLNELEIRIVETDPPQNREVGFSEVILR